MRCPGCGSSFTGGIGTRCPRCGFLPKSVGVTPMEYVVHVGTGSHRVARLRQVPMVVRVLYGLGLAIWILPITLVQYFRLNPMPSGSVGWRTFGLVLAIILSVLVHTLLWAGAFFYGRLVTSDQIAEEAERATS